MSDLGRCGACDKKRKLEPDLKGPHLRGHLCRRCSDILALADDDQLVIQGIADYLVAYERTRATEI